MEGEIQGQGRGRPILIQMFCFNLNLALCRVMIVKTTVILKTAKNKTVIIVQTIQVPNTHTSAEKNNQEKNVQINLKMNGTKICMINSEI